MKDNTGQAAFEAAQRFGRGIAGRRGVCGSRRGRGREADLGRRCVQAASSGRAERVTRTGGGVARPHRNRGNTRPARKAASLLNRAHPRPRRQVWPRYTSSQPGKARQRRRKRAASSAVRVESLCYHCFSESRAMSASSSRASSATRPGWLAQPGRPEPDGGFVSINQPMLVRGSMSCSSSRMRQAQPVDRRGPLGDIFFKAIDQQLELSRTPRHGRRPASRVPAKMPAPPPTHRSDPTYPACAPTPGFGPSTSAAPAPPAGQPSAGHAPSAPTNAGNPRSPTPPVGPNRSRAHITASA